MKVPASELGRFSVDSTGQIVVFLNNSNLYPQKLRFEAGARSGTNETRFKRSSGWSDFLNQKSMSSYIDSEDRIERDSTAYALMHHNRISNNLTKLFDFSVVGRDVGEFTIDVGTLDGTADDYPIDVLVDGYEEVEE